ncbi:MAG TPA: NAD-dependent epimerase/dehydratase family protein [Actinomycetota bacterium]|jgi:nucleoside-diphosphate-sugar epimerase|nr:NAD-dependent epimerase/dehydratase family protein [Actinomycetota bacterium]
MKVFVAGATGALGRRLVPVLIERGHEVVGTTRTPGKADALRAADARPVVPMPWTVTPSGRPSSRPSPGGGRRADKQNSEQERHSKEDEG